MGGKHFSPQNNIRREWHEDWILGRGHSRLVLQFGAIYPQHEGAHPGGGRGPNSRRVHLLSARQSTLTGTARGSGSRFVSRTTVQCAAGCARKVLDQRGSWQ